MSSKGIFLPVVLEIRKGTPYCWKQIPNILIDIDKKCEDHCRNKGPQETILHQCGSLFVLCNFFQLLEHFFISYRKVIWSNRKFPNLFLVVGQSPENLKVKKKAIRSFLDFIFHSRCFFSAVPPQLRFGFEVGGSNMGSLEGMGRGVFFLMIHVI